MANGPGVQYSFSQQGLEDLTTKIKDLHEEFRKGNITYTEYKSGIKEATEQGKAATQEFNQMKGAIAAANPQLLEYTRTMSTFGSVANVVLGVTNAINLAQMAGMGVNKTVMDDKVQLAAITNQAARDLAAFDEKSAQYQTDLQEKDALTNKLAYDLQQMGYQSISTGATLVASAVSIASGISQTAMFMKVMTAEMAPQTAENFAIALASVGPVALTILGPIALVIGAIEGIYYAYRALDPQFAETSDKIYNDMIQNWHLDSLTATFLAPFVDIIVGMEVWGAQWQNFWISAYNSFVTSFANPMINAYDSTIGKVTGQISPMSTRSLLDDTTNAALKNIGLGNGGIDWIPGTQPNTGTIPGAASDTPNQISQIATNSILGLSTSQQVLDAQRQAAANILTGTAATTAAINTGTAATNTGTAATTAAINTGTAATNTGTAATTAAINTGTSTVTDAINSFSTNMMQSFNNQQQAYTAAIGSLTQQYNDLPQKIAEAQKNLAAANQHMQNLMNANSYELANNPSFTPGDINGYGGAMDAITTAQNTLNDLQNAGAGIQQQMQNLIAQGSSRGILDVSTAGIQNVLSAIGLDSTTGIGSVITSALGGAGGVGGAGLTAQQIGQFANTGDYGVFTQAAMQDANPHPLSHQDQQNAWITSLANSMGWTPSYIASHQGYLNSLSSQALGYSKSTNTSASANIGTGAFMGLPGQYGNPQDTIPVVTAASGFDGIVRAPTHFLAGEAGPEAVSISPLDRGSGGKGLTVIVNNNIAGSIRSDKDLEGFIDKSLKTSLKAAGF